MADTFNNDFAQFVQKRIRPAIDMIAVRKRSGLFLALLIAIGVFAVFALAAYFIITPYQKLLGEYRISSWPFILLTPFALAALGFAITYILSLRNIVTEFRETLVNRMAEFIDPALTRQTVLREPDQTVLRDSLLFGGTGQPVSGTDRFLGCSGEASVEFRDIHIPPDKNANNAESLTGIFMKAMYPKAFREPLFVFPQEAEASRSALEQGLRDKGEAPRGGLVRIDDARTLRQILKPAEAPGWGDGFLSTAAGAKVDILRSEQGSELYLGCFGRDLYLAFLSRDKRMEFPGMFEGFDFGNYREFCREAKTAMAVARELGDRTDLWKS
ncbi:MAG: hypothetical protein LBS30_07755 [Planctomycetota bacterium]|jgi:hypothetical protein|nr:hypothetical protein [Planctomycetota bacterium]